MMHAARGRRRRPSAPRRPRSMQRRMIGMKARWRRRRARRCEQWWLLIHLRCRLGRRLLLNDARVQRLSPVGVLVVLARWLAAASHGERAGDWIGRAGMGKSTTRAPHAPSGRALEPKWQCKGRTACERALKIVIPIGSARRLQRRRMLVSYTWPVHGPVRSFRCRDCLRQRSREKTGSDAKFAIINNK